MKVVCIVCDGYWDQLQGGAEYQLYALAHALQDLGYSTHYIYVERGTSVRSTTVGLHPVSLPNPVKRWLYPYQTLLYWKVIRQLNALKPDIVINRVGNALTGICARYGQLNSTPVVWHVANITDLQRWRPRIDRTLFMALVNRMMLNFGIRRVSHIVVQAKYQRALLQENFGRKADALIPNFHPAVEGPIEKSPIPLVLWIANIKEKKRPELFVKLAGTLSESTQARFVMIGRGEHDSFQQSIEHLIESEPGVEWLGELPIDAVNEWLTRAHLFVNTSLVEGFPNTFVQAWMREVPVVSLSFDPDGVLQRRKIGCLSKTFDQLCRDVADLLNDSIRRQTMGRLARSYANDVHGIGVNSRSYAELIESATS